AHPTHPHQPCRIDRFWRIAQIVLHHSGIVYVSSDHQPQSRSWQSSTCFGHTHKREVTHNWSFTALLDGSAYPSSLWQAPQQFIHTIWLIARCFQLHTRRFTSFTL